MKILENESSRLKINSICLASKSNFFGEIWNFFSRNEKNNNKNEIEYQKEEEENKINLFVWENEMNLNSIWMEENINLILMIHLRIQNYLKMKMVIQSIVFKL